MTDAPTLDADALHADALVWDAHACLPLHPDADILALLRHKRAGADFVSVNVGMDMNPVWQVLGVLAAFRAKLRARADLFMPVDTAADIEGAKAAKKLAVGFDLEGGMPLNGRPEMVQLYYDLGVRQIHLAYNRNNEIGGGCYDADIPLTAYGREVVKAINDAGMLMDCSHTGQRTSLDIMEISRDPVIFSHSNPRALHDDGRNITHEQIRACVATGGVICVNGVGRFLGDPEAGTAAILRHIDHLVETAGPDHVGLGIDSCFEQGLDEYPAGVDRAYWWPYYGTGPAGLRIAEPEQLPGITEGLLRLGYAEPAIRLILGKNMLHTAKRVWKS